MKDVLSSVGGQTKEGETRVHQDELGDTYMDMPLALCDYDKINFKVDKNNHPRWYGEKAGRNRQIKADLVLQAFLEPNNKDPKEKFDPQPVPAMWVKGGQETRVIVNGILRADKDTHEVYYQIEGSDVEVPRSELTWQPSYEDQAKDEISQLRQLANELIAELSQAAEELQQLAGVYAENRELERQITELRGGNQLDIAEPPEGKFKRRWLKIAAHAGNLATLRGASQWGLANVQARLPRGSRVYKYSETEYYPESEAKKGRNRLLTAAAVGAAAVTGYLIGKYTGNHTHEVIQNHTHTVFHTETVPAPAHGPGSLAHEIASNTTVGWNPEPHQASKVAISVPGGFDVITNKATGYHEIVHGKQVLDSRVEMTQTGAISQKTLDKLARLKNHPLVKIAQTHLSFFDGKWKKSTVTILGPR